MKWAKKVTSVMKWAKKEKKINIPKGEIRNRKPKKERQYKSQMKKDKKVIYNTLHRKLKIKQHESH